MGEPKQLLRFNGKTLLRHTTEAATDSGCRPVVVILGANAERMKKEIEDLPLTIAVNEKWAEGMSSSLKVGLTRILEIAPDLSAVVVMLCDQPLITDETISRLIETYKKTKKPIVACEYENTIGVPALFAREMFDELLNLRGDTGAKAIIKKHADKTAKLHAPEAAFDIDTPEDKLRISNFKFQIKRDADTRNS